MSQLQAGAAVTAFLGSVAGFRHDVLHVWRDGDALIATNEIPGSTAPRWRQDPNP